MGEVYKARDSRLDRVVAIKILPDAFAKDKERLSRFEREARLLASLNHPNIATIHGFEESGGIRFLVMELVEGETLAERIARGPIPNEEALPLFKQMAEGLEAAHGKGIIHRDLKPANVKLTHEGRPKILDFGLAKESGEEATGSNLSESPTVARGTATGVILGAAPYMSPEQARGKAVDKRADIWVFGCCLYEALTGKTAFRGETVTDTIAKIVEREPDWEALPKGTPPPIHRLLRRCLRKDAQQRLHDIADARLEIDQALTEPTEVAEFHRESGKPTALVALAAVAIAAVSIALWSLSRTSEPPDRPVVRAVLPLASALRVRGSAPSVSISPDGRQIAFAARRGDSTELYVRAIDASVAKAIDGTAGAQMPFFSPDSHWLGYRVGQKLMKVSVSGDSPGPPVTIKDGVTIERGATWGPDGWIVYNREYNTGLSRISVDGGEPEVLTTPIRERNEKTHRLPQMLPGGKAVIFTLGNGDISSFEEASIAVLDLETREYRVLLEGGANPHYSPTGHLVYARDGSIFAVPFDRNALEVKGLPVPLVSGVVTSPLQGAAEFDVSRDGTLVYAPGDAWGEDYRMVWVDRQGRSQPLIEASGAYRPTRISSDGRSLAVYVEGANANVWLYDIPRGTLGRLTFGFDNNMPIWTPDGDRVTFRSSRTGPNNLFWQAAAGGGEAEQLVASNYVKTAESWSPDGKVLAFHERRPETGDDIWILKMEADRTAEPFLQTPFNERRAMFSPDGRWIAYQSDASGRNEIYLSRFPASPGEWQVSNEGGTETRWNPNGRELFYRNADKMMAVDVDSQGELVLGKPRLLFERSLLREDYDVAPDGQRFVMVDESESAPAPTQLNLVLNWFQELEQRVPQE